MNTIKISTAFESYGVIAEPVQKPFAIEAISTEQLIQTLQEFGAVIFRGFEVDLQQFSNFIAEHSTRITCDPARRASAENAQLIQAGDVAMNLHIENGSLPFIPDAQWFFCEIAPSNSSQTTLCDGRTIYTKLSEKTQERFTSKQIQFSRNIPAHLWRKYLATELNIALEDISENHLKHVNQTVLGQNFQLKPDGSVYSRYKTWAIHKSQFSDNLVFANSMLGPSVNYEPPCITWEDGSVIAPSLWEEIMTVTEKHTDEINWENNDVAVIDNSRIMHGRRKVTDMCRKIYGGQSYLKKISNRETPCLA